MVETDHHPDSITGEHGSHPVGAGLGAAAGGAATGAIAGALGGPIGAAVGAVVGGVAGGLAGKAMAEEIDPTVEAAYWEKNSNQRIVTDTIPVPDRPPPISRLLNPIWNVTGMRIEVIPLWIGMPPARPLKMLGTVLISRFDKEAQIVSFSKKFKSFETASSGNCDVPPKNSTARKFESPPVPVGVGESLVLLIPSIDCRI